MCNQAFEIERILLPATCRIRRQDAQVGLSICAALTNSCLCMSLHPLVAAKVSRRCHACCPGHGNVRAYVACLFTQEATGAQLLTLLHCWWKSGVT